MASKQMYLYFFVNACQIIVLTVGLSVTLMFWLSALVRLDWGLPSVCSSWYVRS